MSRIARNSKLFKTYLFNKAEDISESSAFKAEKSHIPLSFISTQYLIFQICYTESHLTNLLV